jgi:lipid-A-disaccharide synthase
MSRIMIIAGEHSGDMHGAALVQATNKIYDNIEWFGIGGPLMRSAGVKTSHDIADMAVLGLIEVLKRYRFFKKVFDEMLALARKTRPDAVVLVDYPGFNLRLAEKLHADGIKVIYYICPQVWAWHRERIPKMAKIIDHLITIFPFEAKHFDGTGLRVTYAGHPLVDATRKASELPATPLPWKGRQRVAILPGSRNQEIRRLLPIMWKAAAELEKQNHHTCFIIAATDNAAIARIRSAIHGIPGPAGFDVVAGHTREILRQADAAMVASGTATIETALMRCPMAVIYKVTPLTYFIAKRLIKIDNIGMVNIVAGRAICPELIQANATPQKIADTILPLISDTPQRSTMLKDIDDVIETMGHGGAADNAARILLKELNFTPKS